MSAAEEHPALKINLTAEEKEAVNTLRERLGSSADSFDDAYLVRFCRARRLDIDLAHAMFVKHLQWRKDYDVENIIKKDYPYKAMWDKLLVNVKHHYDRHGRPISIEKIGRMHVPAFLKHGTNERIIETHIWFMNNAIERMEEKSKELGRPVTTNVSIMDMDGLGVQHRKLTHLFGLVAQMDQDNYPEMLGALYIINAPWLFTAIWAVCQTFLDKVTKAKMHVLGRDLSQMIEDLGAENVPVEYGGTCKQCGGKCMPDDPPVPDEDMEVKEDTEELDLKECTVKNGSKHEIKVQVAAGKAVRWYFRTNKDISFSAEFTPTGGKSSVIVPSARVNSHTYPIQGDYQAKEAGTCSLIWDNSYSYFASKTLRYYIESETQ